MAQKKRFLIIDAHALIHRAFYALPLLTTKKGEPTNAIYGFLLAFFKALKELKPDFVVAAFDLPAPTFRHKEYKGYKAKRPKVPEELAQQIPKVKEVLKSFGVPVLEKEGFEADDIIGTLTKKAVRKQAFPPVENIILTGDLDTLQLINKNTKVYTLKRGVKEAVLYDEEKVRQRYGLEPEQLVDFKALKGDPSDNIPGVPGIGEKTAAKLIKKFGTLKNLYERISLSDFPFPDSLKAKLLANKETAFFSRMLAEIKTNVPVDFQLRECRWQNYDREKVKEVLRNLAFQTLIGRLPLTEEKEEVPGKKEKIPPQKNPQSQERNLKFW